MRRKANLLWSFSVAALIKIYPATSTLPIRLTIGIMYRSACPSVCGKNQTHPSPQHILILDSHNANGKKTEGQPTRRGHSPGRSLAGGYAPSTPHVKTGCVPLGSAAH